MNVIISTVHDEQVHLDIVSVIKTIVPVFQDLSGTVSTEPAWILGLKPNDKDELPGNMTIVERHISCFNHVSFNGYCYSISNIEDFNEAMHDLNVELTMENV